MKQLYISNIQATDNKNITTFTLTIFKYYFAILNCSKVNETQNYE